MSNNEIMTTNESVNLPFQIPQLSERAAEQLNGITLDFPQLKVPSAGAIFFDVDEEPVKEIIGVIVAHKPQYMYYSTDFDGSTNPPDCSSNDGVTGQRLVDGVEGSEYVEMKCADCPYNEFGSATNGPGKACKEKHQLYILSEGRLVPFSLLLPVSSKKAFNAYTTKLFSRGKFLDEVVTSFTLEKAQNATGINYSRVVFKACRDLNREEYVSIQELLKKFNLGG